MLQKRHSVQFTITAFPSGCTHDAFLLCRQRMLQARALGTSVTLVYSFDPALGRSKSDRKATSRSMVCPTTSVCLLSSCVLPAQHSQLVSYYSHIWQQHQPWGLCAPSTTSMTLVGLSDEGTIRVLRGGICLSAGDGAGEGESACALPCKQRRVV